MQPNQINFLYTNIGRGHPFYLDGIVEALIRRGGIGLVRGQSDVFEVSSSISLFAWKAARWMYRWGSSGGPVGRLYNRLRTSSDYNRGGLTLTLMGKSLRSRYADDPFPVIVAHPMLVAILKEKKELIYQHGELVVPREALVSGAETILVPTHETARSFVDHGYPPKDIFISGLCIEPSLIRQAQDAFDKRIEKMQSRQPLVGAFFSSGAEPKNHVKKLVSAVASVAADGGKAIVFAARGKTLANALIRSLLREKVDFEVVDSYGAFPAELPPVLIVAHESRREEIVFTAQLFSHFDYFMAPAHERSNWALGLGLPMFIVGPEIGSFAPLNRDLLVKDGVAVRIESPEQAELFGNRVNSLREDGELERMSRAGWKKRSINGFEKIAEFLIERYTSGK